MPSDSRPSQSITAAMVNAGAEALRGRIAQIGCTCPWDEDGTPPADCACGERAAQVRWNLAYKVLEAALEEPTS